MDLADDFDVNQFIGKAFELADQWLRKSEPNNSFNYNGCSQIPGTLHPAWNPDKDLLSYKDMIAVEIVRDLGYHHIIDNLMPVIRHPLPNDTIEALQQQLRRLMKAPIREEVLVLWLRFPELSVLTEFEYPAVRFPIYKSKTRIWAFQCCLDGREVLVMARRHEEAED